MIRLLAACAVMITATFSIVPAAIAQSVAPIDTLYRTLGLPDIIEIMREEGVEYGLELEGELFLGQGGTRWAATVAGIYDQDWMTEIVRNRMDTELAAEDLSGMIAFFASETGQRFIALEVSARRAMLDDDVDAASRVAFEQLITDKNPRLELLKDFSDASALVDNNVVGAMNSNVAFYTGLAESEAFADMLTQDQILADVWGQESDIRKDTQDWLFSYLNLAYQPMSDDELIAYTAYFRSEDGVVLNRALFAAFDEMFVAISLALGQAAAEFTGAQEL